MKEGRDLPDACCGALSYLHFRSSNRTFSQLRRAAGKRGSGVQVIHAYRLAAHFPGCVTKMATSSTAQFNQTIPVAIAADATHLHLSP